MAAATLVNHGRLPDYSLFHRNSARFDGAAHFSISVEELAREAGRAIVRTICAPRSCSFVGWRVHRAHTAALSFFTTASGALGEDRVPYKPQDPVPCSPVVGTFGSAAERVLSMIAIAFTERCRLAVCGRDDFAQNVDAATERSCIAGPVPR
jgi:hypothetical protein